MSSLRKRRIRYLINIGSLAEIKAMKLLPV